jgi:hypothetical protein
MRQRSTRLRISSSGRPRGDELPGDLADLRSRRARLRQAKQQMEAEHQARIDAHAERLRWRTEREAELGHRLSGRPLKAPPERVPPQTKVNITDPDSRSVKARQGFLQGYNAQAAATSEQIIIAAELLGNANDYGMLESVTNAAIEELAAANVSEQIDVVLADAGYWDSEQIENLAAIGMRPLVPPDSSTNKRNQGANRQGPRYDFMQRAIKSDTGHALYSQRKHAIEPIFGQIKHNRRIAHFQRRGITACRSQWRLIATTHNILKLWRATSPPAAT